MVEGYTKAGSMKSGAEVSEETETQVMYCGPNIPSKGIFTYQVYLGGLPYSVKAMIEEIPEIEKLIVPVSKCEETRAKIRRKGTLEYKYNELIRGKVSK